MKMYFTKLDLFYKALSKMALLLLFLGLGQVGGYAQCPTFASFLSDSEVVAQFSSPQEANAYAEALGDEITVNGCTYQFAITENNVVFLVASGDCFSVQASDLILGPTEAAGEVYCGGEPTGLTATCPEGTTVYWFDTDEFPGNASDDFSDKDHVIPIGIGSPFIPIGIFEEVAFGSFDFYARCGCEQQVGGEGDNRSELLKEDINIENIDFSIPSREVTLIIGSSIAEAGADQEICSGEEATLGIGESLVGVKVDGPLLAESHNISYAWSPTTGLSDPTSANPIASPSVTTTYTLTVTNTNGSSSSEDHCTATDEVMITVNSETIPSFSQIGPFCIDDVAPSLPTISNNEITGTWSPEISTATEGTITYTFTPTDAACVSTATMMITVETCVEPLTADDLSVSDPCSCDNPNNIVSTTGLGLVELFQDILKVETTSGVSVTLSANDGNFLNASGAAIPVGTPIPETSPGVYELEFFTTPDVPANVTVSNGVSTANFITASCSPCASTIPTMSQWGLMIFGLLIMNFGVFFVQRIEFASLT